MVVHRNKKKLKRLGANPNDPSSGRLSETIEDELGERTIKSRMGKIAHKVSKKGKKTIITVDKNDELDAQKAMKNDPDYISGKLRVVPVGEELQTWYESVDTRMQYQLDYGDDWWWKMNEVHDKMLEKLGLDEGCSIDGDETPKVRMTMKEFALKNAWGEIDEAAEYDGRPVKLNNPTRGDVKKYKVYVRNDKGNVVKVEFGDPNMEIKRDDPARRKSFRARHNCDNPGPKYKARYWSCKFWEKGKSVTDLMKG